MAIEQLNRANSSVTRLVHLYPLPLHGRGRKRRGTETGVMGNGEERIALLQGEVKEEEVSGTGLVRRSWIESRKLWRIVGPAIFGRVVIYSLNVITQAFAGHLGDLELASISIANTVVVGFSFGLMVLTVSRLSELYPIPLDLGRGYVVARFAWKPINSLSVMFSNRLDLWHPMEEHV